MDSQGNWQRPDREERREHREEWRQRREEWRMHHRRRCSHHHREGRRVFGLIVLLVGAFLLARLLLPGFVGPHFGWPLILIIIGLLIGVKNRFRKHAWWILILIGGAYLYPFPVANGVMSTQLVWPLLLLLGGAVILTSRRQSIAPPPDWDRDVPVVLTEDADTLRVDAMFGGRKEVVTSRNFKGGTVRASFSGVEINLSGAEGGEEPMVLDIQVSFGGVEIIVPAHWDVQNEIQPTLGSVEDQRSMRSNDPGAAPKLLILRGSCSFGSVEIKNF